MHNVGRQLKIAAWIWMVFVMVGAVVGSFFCSTVLISVFVLFGGILLALIFSLVLYGFGIIVEKVEKDQEPKYSSSKKLSSLARKKDNEDGKQSFWVCECGMKNAEHSASCKGCGNSRTGAVVMSGNGGAYKKCTCGAMVKMGEKCPMCGKMVN